MKNTDTKKEKSGIVMSLIAVILIAAGATALIIFGSSTRYNEFSSYALWEINRSGQLKSCIVSAITAARGVADGQRGRIAIKYPGDGRLEESSRGVYEVLTGYDGFVLTYKCPSEVKYTLGSDDTRDASYIGLDAEYADYYYVVTEKIDEMYPSGTIITVSPYDAEQKIIEFYVLCAVLWGGMLSSVAGIILLIISFFAKGKVAAYIRLSEKITSHIFFELKWAVFFAVSIGAVQMFAHLGVNLNADYERIAILTVMTLVCLWYTVFSLKLMYYDIKAQGVPGYFRNNLLVFIFRKIAKIRHSERPSKRIAVYVTVYLCIMTVLTALSLLTIAANGYAAFFFIFVAAVAVTAAFCVVMFRTVRELDGFCKRLLSVQNGAYHGHTSAPGSDVYALDEALMRIEADCRHNAEQALREEKTRIELITNVSHDLRTPLTSIISYTQLLSQLPGFESGEACEYIGILQAKEARLKKLIEDLFEVSKASAENIEINIELIDLRKLVDQELSYSADEIAASGLDFRVSLPDNPVMISADGTKLHRTVDNLLSNILKYSLERTRVYVDLEVCDGKASLILRNISRNVPGTPAERLTERFVRGDESRSCEGSGLGLAIAKAYTELCGGRLSVEVDGDLFKVTVSFDIAAGEPSAVENFVQDHA